MLGDWSRPRTENVTFFYFFASLACLLSSVSSSCCCFFLLLIMSSLRQREFIKYEEQCDCTWTLSSIRNIAVYMTTEASMAAIDNSALTMETGNVMSDTAHCSMANVEQQQWSHRPHGCKYTHARPRINGKWALYTSLPCFTCLQAFLHLATAREILQLTTKTNVNKARP